jgi:Mn-dependent DtxR family transcriptional regulator
MSKLACTQTLKALKRKGLVEYEKSIGWYQTVNGAAEMDRWEEAL